MVVKYLNLKLFQYFSVFLFFISIGCNSIPESPVSKRLEEIMSEKQDKIEKEKDAIFSDSDFEKKKRFISSIFKSHKEKAAEFFPFAQQDEFFILFNYKLTNELIQAITNDNKYPRSFKECLLKNVPIYLFIQVRNVNWNGDGNRFQDGGLTRDQVGENYDAGNYPSERGKMYIINFMYLDKKYETSNACFSTSAFMTDSPYFGIIEVCRIGNDGSLNFLNHKYQVHLNDQFAPVDASFSDQEVYSLDNETLAEKILKTSYISLDELFKNAEYGMGILESSKNSSLVLNSGEEVRRPLKWQSFIQKFSSAVWYIHPNIELFETLIPDRIETATGFQTANSWIRGLTDSDFSTMDLLIKEEPLSNDKNIINFQREGYSLSFKYQNSDWKLVYANLKAL